MEPAQGREDVVHPEVRAHINSLVSALGGFNDEDDGTYYRLGDDALDVLRDIKKWLRFYDEKTNRMDVARCLADANLVSGDLIHILALWTENSRDDKYKSKVALACFEILAALTWPIEKHRETMTNNHHRHVPVLELAQLKYKRDIINFDHARLLHTAVRAALPSMAVPIRDRTQRDNGVIKIVLYIVRNIAMIAPPPGLQFDGDESQISRSATIDAFSYQDIFFTILTLASNMGEDFKTEDMVLLEVLFHLIKRVDTRKLFLNQQDLRKVKADELASAMKKEASMLRSYNRKAPTRHSRFGTMLWVQKSDGKVASLSGQGALADVSARERKMDESKTFRPPRRAAKEEMEPKDLGTPVVLNTRANKQLREFVEEFLDSGFNPLFTQVRKTIEGEGLEVLHHHTQLFFYTVAWFLEAERARQHSRNGQNPSSEDQVSSFQLVAAVLNQEMFITLKRHLVKSYTDNDWRTLNAVMRCFTQILLTVQEMFVSENEEDREIAENALIRLFYEEDTHDIVAAIVRNYKGQGFDYLDAATELVHTYTRVLEAYSKENVDMQVRSKKRTRMKKKQKTRENPGEGDADADNQDDGGEKPADDQAAAEKTSRERKFDFKKFANRFVVQDVVDTFIKYTRYYRDLDDSQLKRAHRYFYRLAFKQDMSVMLFRVDIIHLLYNMIKGPEPLDSSTGMYKEWEEIVKQIIRRCVKKIEERPALIIELLFSKTTATAYYLEYGHSKQVLSTASLKPAAELLFRRLDLVLEEQIAIAVGLLTEKQENEHIEWVQSQLSICAKQREAWETSEKARLMLEAPDGTMSLPDNWEAETKEPETYILDTQDDARKTAILRNPRLRLLMNVVGFELLSPSLDEELGSSWLIPSRHSAKDLEEYKDLIQKAVDSPPMFEDGGNAESQVRRKTAPRKKVAYDDDDENDIDNDFLAGDDNDNDDDALFPKNAPWEKVDGAGPKKGRRRRRRDKKSALGSDAKDQSGTDEEDASARADKARLRRKHDLDKQRKIKSSLTVDPADDESDVEGDAAFFAREEAIRQRVRKALEFAPTDATQLQENMAPASAIAETMKRLMAESDDDDDDHDDHDNDNTNDDDDGSTAAAGRKESSSRLAALKKRKSRVMLEDDASDDEDAASSPPAAKRMATAPKQKKRLGFLVDSSEDEDEEMDDVDPSLDRRDDEDGNNNDESGHEEMDTDGTPLSPHPQASDEDEEMAADRPALMKTQQGNKSATASAPSGRDADEDEDDAPVASKRRPRAKHGFLMDDSDDE